MTLSTRVTARSKKNSQRGIVEMREEEATKAALAASLDDMGSPAGEPVILEGQRVPSVNPPHTHRNEARAAPPSNDRCRGSRGMRDTAIRSYA